MAEVEKARVFMSGRSQAVRIPAAYRFASKEVYIRRDPQSGDVILSEPPAPGDWEAIFAALDEAGVPEDLLTPAERAHGPSQVREPLDWEG